MESGDEQTIAYDLRQSYARILTMHMVQIFDAQDNLDYAKWYRHLKLLWSAVLPRVTKKRRIVSNKYSELNTKAIGIVNQYTSVYLGSSREPRGVDAVEQALSRLQRFIYRVMHNNGMFGSNWDDSGL